MSDYFYEFVQLTAKRVHLLTVCQYITMFVVTRNGKREEVSFDRVLTRIKKLSSDLPNVNPTLVAQKVCTQIEDGITTARLDEFAAETCATMQARNHPEYGTLAARIVIDNHHKNTPATFAECCAVVKSNLSDKLIHVSTIKKIQDMIVYERDFMFDYFGFKTLEKSYLLKNDGVIIERPQHMWMRVAIEIHCEEQTDEHFDYTINFDKIRESYDALSQGYFIHATPTLFNAGTNHPQLSSCFLLNMKEDSIKGIYETLSDCAQISKWAGGIGLSVHNIRARNSKIHGTNGTSTGLVPMLKVYNDTAKYVNQGGKRNGSFAIYLEPWHADIEDFLRLRLNTGAEEDRARDLFYALWIPDLFMKRMEANENWSLMCPNECPGLDECCGPAFETLYTSYEKAGKARKSIPAQKIWTMILDAQIQTGTPYLLYKDACNLKSNQQHLGTIKSSNLCVAPETLILTDKGYFPIVELRDQLVRVWNGTNWSETTVRKTGEKQKLITVNLSNGGILNCTPYHKFIIHNGYNDNKTIKNGTRVDAKDLKDGMYLKKFDAPILDGTEEFKYPYTHGFFCGDGTYSNGRPTCSLYGDKKNLVKHLDIRTMSGVEDSAGRLNTGLHLDIPQKFAVPLASSISTKLRWFEGLCDADGTVSRNGTNESIQISNINFVFLDKVRLLLLTLGIHAKVTKNKDARVTSMPDGHGGKKDFDCQPIWRVLVSSNGLYNLGRLGFSPKRLVFMVREPQRCAEQFIKVECIVDVNRYDDTYCFTEPINNAGVFNGILTGNCAEIVEYTSPSETAVCNLGSIALPRFVKEGVFDFDSLRAYTCILAENLDNVIDRNYYPTEECKRSNMGNRPIGIGVQGLADVFAKMGLAWTSPEARTLNREIFENIYYAAMQTSMILAIGKGANKGHPGSPASAGLLQYDLWNETPVTTYLKWDQLKADIKSYGLRNSLSIALMPTASTSQILGNNECFEPVTSNLYVRHVLAGDFIVVNKYLVDDLSRLGLWTAAMRTLIIAHNGSVQAIEDIPEDIREKYKTAWEIPQKTLINMSRDRAPFVCQSQSLNLFVSDPTYARISSMHVYAWKQGLKTGCYYLRTKAVASAQQFTVEPQNCTTCSA